MARNFQCIACGKCCYGQLPLTVNDALDHADIFPLAIVWTPLRQKSKDFLMFSHLGVTIKLASRKELAVMVAPTAYMPSSFPCPVLGDDNLCAIHANKPLRCRTMPFYPYREEQYQAELLTPRPGWVCDISDAAPLVFHDKKIVHCREDFDQERLALEQQRPVIRAYAEYMLKYNPQLTGNLVKAAASVQAGQIVTSLSSFLTGTRNSKARQIAEKQVGVLKKYVDKTADKNDLSDFHKNYQSWLKEMTFMSSRV